MVIPDDFISHSRPGEVLDPGGMGGEQLRGTRRHPFGHAVVVFLRWVDPPAHVGKHVVEHGDLFREAGDVWEFGDYVDHQGGNGV